MLNVRHAYVAPPFVSTIWLMILLLAGTVSSNVEKIIFTAPDSMPPSADASIDNLYLTSLNPGYPTVRAHLNASFPTDADPKGAVSWYLLEDLNPGQRYEVRVCWLATQPTSFWVYTHTLSNTMDEPDLISSLTLYANSRRDVLRDAEIQRLQTRRRIVPTLGAESSLLLLQIHAAADYYSLNRTLMENVPPVLVDIILDPYLLNIFPKSLVPTACYLVVTATFAWYLSAWIATQLCGNHRGPTDSASVSVADRPLKKNR